MKANKGASGNNVVADRQWVRRVKQEEYNMIDSFGGRMQDKINAAREEQNKNHFYPQHTRMNQQPVGAAAAQHTPMRQPEETKSRASRARDSDGLDSVSQVSVMTPKSRTDDRSSRAAQSSVSYVSKNSKSTTVSTKQKLQDLEQQL